MPTSQNNTDYNKTYLFTYIHGDISIHSLDKILAIMPNAAHSHGVHSHTLDITAASRRRWSTSLCWEAGCPQRVVSPGQPRDPGYIGSDGQLRPAGHENIKCDTDVNTQPAMCLWEDGPTPGVPLWGHNGRRGTPSNFTIKTQTSSSSVGSTVSNKSENSLLSCHVYLINMR